MVIIGENFVKIAHIHDHKIILNKFKTIKIIKRIQRMFSNHNGIKLENSKQEISINLEIKHSTILNNPYIKEEVSKRIKIKKEITRIK